MDPIEQTLINRGFIWDGKAWAPGKKTPLTPKGEIAKINKFHAVKVEAEGIKYDSKREYAFKQLLDRYGIHYEIKRKYILQEGFVYGEEKIRPIAIIPDFTILKKNAVLYRNEAFAIVDIKGMIMVDFKLKVKMLKRVLINQQQRAVPVFMPRNKKEIEITIQKLISIIK